MSHLPLQKKRKEIKALYNTRTYPREQINTMHTFTIVICSQDKEDIFAERNKHECPQENSQNLIAMFTEPQLPRKHFLVYIQK
jgi:hypothetical protein